MVSGGAGRAAAGRQRGRAARRQSPANRRWTGGTCASCGTRLRLRLWQRRRGDGGAVPGPCLARGARCGGSRDRPGAVTSGPWSALGTAVTGEELSRASGGGAWQRVAPPLSLGGDVRRGWGGGRRLSGAVGLGWSGPWEGRSGFEPGRHRRLLGGGA